MDGETWLACSTAAPLPTIGILTGLSLGALGGGGSILTVTALACLPCYRA